MPKVDYAAADQSLPDGVYDAVLDSWELKEGSKGPYYNLTFVLQDEQYRNRKVWSMLSLSPPALWRFKRDMIRLGARAEDMAPGSDVDTDDVVASTVGGPCRLKLKQETYTANDGTEKVRSVVDEVLGAGITV